MIISKELFNKLSKKSQEEFKSKIEKVREIELPMIWAGIGNYMIGFVAFILLILPLYYMAFGIGVLKNIIIATVFGLRIFIGFIVIGFIVDLIIIMVKRSKIEKIKKEYFKVEVKDEKRKQ